MDRIVERGRLYDFYGELLTPHQREVYEAAVYDDLSLSEIAEKSGTTKQAVHDLIKRTTASLSATEEQLHMIRRYDEVMGAVNELRACAGSDERTQALLTRIEEAMRS